MTTKQQMSPSMHLTGDLIEKFDRKAARLGVMGLGYVGLPLTLAFARRGFRATGFDIDPAKIAMLQRGESYFRHIPSALLSEPLAQKRFEATSDFQKLTEMDAILICVPTPLDDHRVPDLSYVCATAEVVSAHLRAGQLVVLESTTYPGTTEEVVLPILEKSGLRCPIAAYKTDGERILEGENPECSFLLAFSPEREDPGNQQFRTEQIPKIIGGVNGPSTLVAQALYRSVFTRAHLVSSTRAAEMTKLLENIYRCVNIGLVNELKLLCLRMGLDIWEIIEAAKTKPFGFTPFYPGPGLGGHCIPIDPFYLSWKAKEFGFATRFIELAGEINVSMPDHVVAAIADAMNRRGEPLQNARLLILGISYKKDVDDLRESPALEIMKVLQRRGVQVDYNDPHFPHLPKTRKYDFRLASVELTPDTLSKYHAVVIVSDHSAYDYAMIVRHARLVIDTRNATRNVADDQGKVVRC